MSTLAREALLSSKTVEWFTPKLFTEAVKKVFGGKIDLDPASCTTANQSVGAEAIYDKTTNGLDKKWHGKVFLNPPYGKGGQEMWSKKLISEFLVGNIEEGILLVNAVTDTKWFKPLWKYSICFVDKRIKFVAEDGVTKKSPTHGSVFVYIGPNKSKFEEEFKQFGTIVHSAK